METGKWKMWRAKACAGAALVVCLMFSGGCAAEEALIDGFYGGISDAVATVVGEALLSGIGVGG